MFNSKAEVPEPESSGMAVVLGEHSRPTMFSHVLTSKAFKLVEQFFWGMQRAARCGQQFPNIIGNQRLSFSSSHGRGMWFLWTFKLK